MGEGGERGSKEGQTPPFFSFVALPALKHALYRCERRPVRKAAVAVGGSGGGATTLTKHDAAQESRRWCLGLHGLSSGGRGMGQPARQERGWRVLACCSGASGCQAVQHVVGQDGLMDHKWVWAAGTSSSYCWWGKRTGRPEGSSQPDLLPGTCSRTAQHPGQARTQQTLAPPTTAAAISGRAHSPPTALRTCSRAHGRHGDLPTRPRHSPGAGESGPALPRPAPPAAPLFLPPFLTGPAAGALGSRKSAGQPRSARAAPGPAAGSRPPPRRYQPRTRRPSPSPPPQLQVELKRKNAQLDSIDNQAALLRNEVASLKASNAELLQARGREDAGAAALARRLAGRRAPLQFEILLGAGLTHPPALPCCRRPLARRRQRPPRRPRSWPARKRCSSSAMPRSTAPPRS